MTPAEKAYRPDIDGLRAIAIIGVVLFHAGIGFCPGGFSGVDLFFTISGFLIGGHIYEELRDGKFSFLRFYHRRAKRILPALFTVLIAIQALSMLLLSPAESALVGRDSFATALSVSNVVFWKKAVYFAPSSDLNPLLMTWSLGVEEQFYMIIPILMVLLTRAKKSLLIPFLGLICLASFGFAWVQLPTHPSMVFYLIQGRAWELGAGVILAVFLADSHVGGIEKNSKALQWMSVAGLLMILVPMALMSRQTPFPGPAALPLVAGAVILITTEGSWINTRILGVRPMAFVGRVSYSWYLFHWPALAFLRILLGRPLSSLEGVGAVMAAFAFAIPSYFLIEQPLRRSTMPPIQLLSRYAAACAVMLCISGAIWGSGGVPIRYPALAARESAAIMDILSDPCIIRNVSAKPNVTEQCYEQGGYSQFVALWGDSHAAAMAPAIRSIAHKYGYGYREADMANCPPLPGLFFLSRKNPEYHDLCKHFADQELEEISHDPRIKIVILGAAWSSYLENEDDWMLTGSANRTQMPDETESLNIISSLVYRNLQALRNAGKLVVILEDFPIFNSDPLWRMRTREISLRRKIVSAWTNSTDIDPGSMPMARKEVDYQVTRVLRNVAGSQGAATFNLKQSLCDKNGEQCLYRVGQDSLYMNAGHVSTLGAYLALANFFLPTPTYDSGGTAKTSAPLRPAKCLHRVLPLASKIVL